MRKEIFRSGKHTDAQGRTFCFTDSDLKKIVASYDRNKHEAPVVIGHPQNNNPAYAWVGALSFSEGVITAEFEDVNVDFAEMVDKKLYKNVSASFYLPNAPNNPLGNGEYYLRHVGYLGAEPPVVKGLKPTEFSDNGDCVEFSETSSPADTVADDASLKAQLTQKSAEIAAQKQEIANLKAKQIASEKAQTEKSNTDFAESLIKDGKLLPKHRDTVITILNHAPADVLNLSEGEPVLFSEVLKSLLSDAQTIDLSETATKAKAADTHGIDDVQYSEGVDDASKVLDQKIRAYMKENKCTYNEAFRAVK